MTKEKTLDYKFIESNEKLLIALHASAYKDIITHGRDRKWKDEFIVDLILDQCKSFMRGYDKQCKEFIKNNSIFKTNNIKGKT